MPPFNNNTDDETETKKPSASEVAAGITNVLLILIIAFFTCASLWLGVFAIPSFFVFFRASVVAISSVREGINQLQGSIDATHPLAFRSLRFGAAAGLIVTFIAGGLTIFLLELIRYWVLEDNDDAMSVFSGFFRIIGAFVFTHLGVSVLQQGSRMVRSASFYQKEIHDIRTRPETAGGPDRSQMFHLGLGASLREGVISYLYMLPLGGAYESKHLPLPAVLGAIAGVLSARYIAPALLWGGIVGESEGILPDSNAKAWALRREMLTNQYVANLAAKAQGGAAFGESQGEDVKKPGDALYASVASDAEVDDDGVAKNLSQLSAGALREMFQDSNVDPAAFDDMDYAQKRLLLLKSSKAAFAPSTDASNESDEEDDEPAILTMQNSAQWPSVRSMGDGGSEEKLPDRRPPLIPPNPNGVGSRTIFHRRGQSLVSISEDADGYINRGGYSDQGSGLGLITRGSSGGSEASHARSGSGGSAHHARMASNDTPMTQHHQRMRSAMKQGGGSGMTGRPRDQSTASSVRFENDGDDARSVMDGFQHRHLAQVGARDPSLELDVMEETLSQYSRNRGNGRTISFMPGSPQHTAPGAPISSVDLEESVGGNLALGSSRTSSKRSNGGLLSFMKSSRRVGDSFKVHSGGKEDEEEEDEEMGSAGFNGRNAIPNDVADKSFFATIALALSAFVVFGCCAGLLKLGVLDFKGLFSDSETEVFDICDISDSCCSPDEQGSVAEMFFAIFNSQFGYTCRETLIGIIAWAAYWLYPVTVCMYATRMCCFSSIPLKEQPQMPVMPERRMAGAYAAAVFSARSTKRFLGGAVPDPARIKMHPTHFWIKLSALLNVIAGTAYIWWRAARSMPDDPASPIWNWLFFAGECILMMGVWTSHLQRAFPAVRDVCNMDDLCEIDPGVSKEALVCIMVPTAGEKMKNIKHVLLGAYSQRLWQTAVPTSHQLRVAVLDEKGRHEVRDLVEKVYKLAKSLINPAVQLELSTKFNEPYVTPKIFMDYFNQMDALDKFVFAPVCHPAFDLAVKLENYAGPKTGKFARATSSAAVNTKGKRKTKAANIRLEEGFKEVFNTSPNIPSMIYSARANPGTPKVSPKAGNMNASIFPNSPGEEPVIGDPARIVVVNDARHRLKTEFLQRTVPYFFKLNRRTGKHYEWADVGFVQTPQRFEDLGDGDPLGNHAVLTFFVSNVSKDGVGGVTSCGQGSLWRVDALRGMAADGRQTADHVKTPDIIGHDCGFRSEVLIEDTHTSLEFFKLQWRSAYVCEPGETLAVCVEQPNTVAWRVKQVFRWHIGAVQLLLKDGVTFLCTSRMPTPLHKMFGLDSLTYYIQAVGGLFIILMPIMFSIFHETPFETLDLEFVYFFFPYILTATIPTLLSVGWKNVNPNRVLTDEQFWLSTCYVQVWALALGLWNRITCANPDNAWNLKCPVWPLGLIFCLLGVSAVNSTVYWMFYLMFDISGIWIFLASFGACIIVMYSIWPMVKLWWPGAIGLPSKYHAKFVLVLLFIALSSVLVVYIDIDT